MNPHYLTIFIVFTDQPPPPPLPNRPPPKKFAVIETQTTITQKSKETKSSELRQSGKYATRIEPTAVAQEVYATRIEPDVPDTRVRSAIRESGMYATRIEPDPVPAQPAPRQEVDYAAFEKAITELYPQNKTNFLVYHRVPWVLHIRKEVRGVQLHPAVCSVLGE